MKLPRRQFLYLAAGAATLPAVSRVVWAQAYPSRPVHWIVSFAAGGPNDIVARIIGQHRRNRAGLRGQHLVRDCGAQGHPIRDSWETKPR
jgi:tripartite-type tricarboxylate transporter receptor subunit TctC